ncbi:MAG: FAD-binding domain-containing protein [Granulosicoccus sp.]
MNTPVFEHFLCSLQQIQERIDQIDPWAYDKTRNYLDGDVTWLSPFVTHGVISTRQIADRVLTGHKAKSCYRLLFELGWREFFHRTWQLAGDKIFDDIRHPQTAVWSRELPNVLLKASTGIEVIDECLDILTSHGVMHNHARMWVAGLSCNMAGTYWQEPARWLHYHLLDGDLASNTLSWQWIAGTFSHKKYVANQDNINKYSRRKQSQSWLDIPYEEFDPFTPPSHLKPRGTADYSQTIPGMPITDLSGSVALRSIWQLDPGWQSAMEQHIVFIDTELAERWPMSPLRWQFVEHWAKHCQATIYHGTIHQLRSACTKASLTRAEYPACNEWPGDVVEREWLYPMPEKSFSSFSQYFKQVKHHAGL